MKFVVSNIVDPFQLSKLLPNMSSQSQRSGSSAEIHELVSISCADSGGKPEEQCNTKIDTITLPNLLLPASFCYLHEVAKRMISSGYVQECLHVYREVRSSILEHILQKLDIQNLHKDGAKKNSPDCADAKVTDLPKHLKVSILLLFAGEQKLCDKIFDQIEPHRSRCFVSVVENSMCALLNSAEDVIASRRLSEIFFHVLDLYNAMDDVLPEVKNLFQGMEGAKLYQRYDNTLHMLAQTSLETFGMLEQTVCKVGIIKTNVKDGTVHPLTSHVVNFVKLLSDYQTVLEKLLNAESTGCDCLVILSTKNAQIFTALLNKLETKSRLYKDPALAQIFLMNNTQFIIRSVQRCKTQCHLGEEWLQRHQSIVQLHATGYLHAAWDKVLQFLNPHGLMNGNRELVGAGLTWSLFKERLKLFNQTVDERCRKQMQWIVHDSQLRIALQKAVMESVVPAYGLFLKRFSGGLERSKNDQKYIKYTVEELEHLLKELFEGKTS